MDREVELERWREAGKEVGHKLGVVEERKRIIKLLENAECQGEDDWCGTIQQAIALIKGENK